MELNKFINPKIGLDLDGVVCDFHQKLIDTYNSRRQPDSKELTISDIDCELEKLPTEIYQKVISIFNEPGWFTNLKSLPDAIPLVTQFMDLNYETTICTAPARDLKGCINPKSAAEKYDWLQQNLPFLANNAIITKHKEIVGVDLLVDDTGYNIKNWCREYPEGIGYLVDQPWNQNFKDLPMNSVRGSLHNVPKVIENFWCKTRGKFIYRYEELLNWSKK